MRTITILLALLVATPAGAKPPRKAERSDQDADAAAQRGKTHSGLTIYEFEGDELTGDVISPDGRLIQWRMPARHPSLIRVRDNFVGELIRLATDV
jgi:hypothetical protein